ncbi:hypothetical protein FRC16_000456, partial [Serendipita sp. 398]
MPPKEPTKHQLSHRLQFQSHTPNFLKAFQARVSGRPLHDDDEYDEDDPRVVSDEDEGGVGGGSGGVKLDEFGREIRMGSEEREMREKKQGRRGGGGGGAAGLGPGGRSGGGGGGGADGEEEGDDEAPTIVVLKEGKHLSAREVENERRRAKGLPPLAEDAKDEGGEGEMTTKSSTKTGTTTTTGSGTATTKKSGVQLGGRTSGANKRKIISIREDEEGENEDEDRGGSQ